MDITISIVIAFISAVAACSSAIAAYKSAKAANATTEFQSRQLISEAKNKFLNHNNKNGELDDFLLEELNNAYDEISSKYISNKIDKKFFERMYKNEIIKQVETFNPKKDKYADLYEAYEKLKLLS